MPQLPFNHEAFVNDPRIAGLHKVVVANVQILEAFDPHSGDRENFSSRISELHGAAEGLNILVGSALSAKPGVRDAVASYLRPVFEAIDHDLRYPEPVRSEARSGLDKIEALVGAEPHAA